MPGLLIYNDFNHISSHSKKAVSKRDLDNIYFGICKIANSFERLKTKLTNRPLNPKIRKISSELNVCKSLLEQMYRKFGLAHLNHVVYIDAVSSKEFIDKLNFVISETIFRCAAVCNADNTKKFTDFSLIIMVLADLNKNLAL